MISLLSERERLLTETGGHQVEEGRLGVFVDVHHEDGEEEAGQVSCSTSTGLVFTIHLDFFSPVNMHYYTTHR